MILGMTALTFVHVALSLVGILSGFIVMFGWLAGKGLDVWTTLFLASTVATSVTGFFFPFHGFTPAIGVGIVSLIVLAIAIVALYARHLAGAWRRLYVVSAAMALYLNVFVVVVQLFQKVPVLKAAAPTDTDPPFLVTQIVVLAIFIVLTILAAKRFRNETSRAA